MLDASAVAPEPRPLTLAGCGGGGSDKLTITRVARRSSSRRSSSSSRRRPAPTSRCATATAPSSRRRSPRRAKDRPPTCSSRRIRAHLAPCGRAPRRAARRVARPCPEHFRDPEGRWVGTSGRSRVIAYNTDALSEGDVPDSVFDLTDERWRGKVGVAPTNASFQAFVTAMRCSRVRSERASGWRRKANGADFYEKNTPIVEAVASGEIDLGLVNHYYLYLVKEEQPDAAGREPLPAGRRSRARSSRPPASACSRTPTTATTPSVRRVPALRRGPALLHGARPRRPSTRSWPGSREGGPAAARVARQGPTSTRRRSAKSSRRRSSC